MNGRSRGVTFIELMIGMVLAGLLTGLVISIYVGREKSAAAQSAILQIQNQATKTIGILSREIEQAGWIGCAKLTRQFPIKGLSHYTLTAQNKVAGNAKELTIRYARPLDAKLIDMTVALGKIVIEAGHTFHAGEVLLISDCKHAEVIKIKQVYKLHGMQIILATEPMHYLYRPSAQINHLVINRFYVDKTKEYNLDGSSLYALYVDDVMGQKMRLVDGVEKINLNYYQNDANTIYQIFNFDDATQLAAVGIELSMHIPPYKKSWYGFAKLS